MILKRQCPQQMAAQPTNVCQTDWPSFVHFNLINNIFDKCVVMFLVQRARTRSRTFRHAPPQTSSTPPTLDACGPFLSFNDLWMFYPFVSSPLDVSPQDVSPLVLGF